MRRLIPFILFIVILLPQWGYSQNAQQDKHKENHEKLNQLQILQNQFEKMLAFPEDPANKLVMDARLRQFNEIQEWYSKQESLKLDGNDSIRFVLLIRETQVLLPEIRKLKEASQLPLHKAYLKTGERHLEKSDTTEAMIAFQKSINAKESYIPAIKQRALLYIQNQNIEKAIQDGIRLSLLDDEAKAEALSDLFHNYTTSIEKVQESGEHSKALELLDSLLQAYSSHKSETSILEDMKTRSREAIVDSYRSVAYRALNGGKIDLAIEYRTLAKEQEEDWFGERSAEDAELFGEICVYAARTSLMALESGAIQHASNALTQADQLYDQDELPELQNRKYRQILGMISQRIIDSLENSPHPNHFYSIWNRLNESYPDLAHIPRPKKRAATLSEDDDKIPNTQIPLLNSTKANMNWLYLDGNTVLSSQYLKPHEVIILEWISTHQSEAEYLAWKGDTAKATQYLDTLVYLSSLPNENIQFYAQNSATEIQSELDAWICRKQARKYENALQDFNLSMRIGEWTSARNAHALIDELSSAFPQCEFKPKPAVEKLNLLAQALEYEKAFRDAMNFIKLFEWANANMTLEKAEKIYRDKLKGKKGVRHIPVKKWILENANSAYLKHRADKALKNNKPGEALDLLKKLHEKGVSPEDVSEIQNKLGKLLAEEDLKNTELTNPKTLLSKHIPLTRWYRDLQKAYSKRFRKG